MEDFVRTLCTRILYHSFCNRSCPESMNVDCDKCSHFDAFTEYIERFCIGSIKRKECESEELNFLNYLSNLKPINGHSCIDIVKTMISLSICSWVPNCTACKKIMHTKKTWCGCLFDYPYLERLARLILSDIYTGKLKLGHSFDVDENEVLALIKER